MNQEYINSGLISDLDPYSPVPLYLQLMEQLENVISTGVFAVDELLPSEHQLMVAYNISRSVVRQALAALAHKGLVYTE